MSTKTTFSQNDISTMRHFDRNDISSNMTFRLVLSCLQSLVLSLKNYFFRWTDTHTDRQTDIANKNNDHLISNLAQ